MSKKQNIRNFISVLLLIVVGFGAYFFFFINRREQNVTQHHLRLLSSAADYAADAMEGKLGSLKLAMGEADYDKKVKLIKDMGGRSSGSMGKAQLDTLTYSPMIDRLEFVVGGGSRGKEAIRLSTAVALEFTGGEPQITFVTRQATSQGNKQTKFALRGLQQSSLRAVVAPTLPTEFFHAVILARLDGQVLFQEGRSQLQFRTLNIEDKESQGAGTLIEPKSCVHDVRVAGEKFKLFLQPLTLPMTVYYFDENGSPETPRVEKHWVVCGLIPSSEYRAMTMAISPMIVLAVLGVIIVGLLCLPFLKIRYMGIREELRHTDVEVLFVATLISASLVTFALLLYVTRGAQAEDTRESLESLAANISGQFRIEIEQADSQLGAFTLEREELSGAGGAMEKTALLNDHDDLVYPFFEMAYWQTSDGWQTPKWTIRNENTPVSNFKTRRYFSRAYRQQLWPGFPADELFTEGRFVESIRSKTTGSEYAVLTRRMRREEPVVAAILTTMLSLNSPALPPGHGFAIVDQSGFVQFHTDPARNVRENFFDELESAHDLRAAVLGKQNRGINATYRTTPIVAWVQALENTPWSLIVWMDHTNSRLWALEVLTFALVLYSAYVFAFLVVCVLLYTWFKRRFPPEGPRQLWFWPRAECRYRYYALIATCAVVAIVWLILVLGNRPFPLLLFTVLSPMAVMLNVYASLIKADERSEGAFSGETDFDIDVHRFTYRIYAGALFLVVVIAAILPALTFFRLAYDEHIVLFTKASQIEFANALITRRDRVADQYKDVSMNENNRDQIKANLDIQSTGATGTLGVYSPKEWQWKFAVPQDTAVGCARDYKQQPITASLDRFVQNYGLQSSLSRSLTGSRAGFFCWSERDTLKNALTMTSINNLPAVGVIGVTTDADLTDFRKLQITSVYDRLSVIQWGRFWLIGFVGLIVLGILIFVILKYAFLMGIRPPQPVSAAAFLGDNEIALRHKYPDLQEIKHKILLRFRLDDRSCCKELDLDKIRSAESVDGLTQEIVDSGAKHVLLTKFDHGLKEPDIVQRKLDLLEKLNTLDGVNVTIESSVDPLYFLTSRLEDRWETKDALNISIPRWAAALQPYARFRRMKTERKAELAQWFRRDEVPKSKPEVIDTLISEGAFNSTLQEFAKRLSVHEEIMDFDRERVLDNLLDLAYAHYRRIWTSCSTNEKVLLHRIAKEGFVNRRAVLTLKSLIRRQLVVMAPNCRIMNETFRRFVLRAEPPEVIERWESKAAPSAWSKLKMPIAAAVLVLLAFFFATQREAFQQSLGIFAALAASAPALIKLFGAMSQMRSDSK